MRLIEFSLSILTIIISIMVLIPHIVKQRILGVFLLLLILVVFAQISFEGFRWQYWPVAVAILLQTLVFLYNLLSPQNFVIPKWLAVFSIVLALISLTLGWLLPVPKPYPTTGPYQVGTLTFPLVDTSRSEIYSDHPNQPREIMVQAWYPANPAPNNQQALWMENIESAGPAIANFLGLPGFLLDHLQYAETNSYLNAPALPEGPFPVLVFSHGWSGFKEQNIYQVEELASHGYVVVGINHTYVAVMSTFPDGRNIKINEDALPSGVSDAEYNLASNRLVSQWAEDISFTLDELEKLNNDRNWLLHDQLDMNLIGIFGHSTGGGAAAQFCGSDSRCKAALMMDLWAEPVSDQIIDSGLYQPFLLIHSEEWATTESRQKNFNRVGSLTNNSSESRTEFIIKGTKHHDFTSIPLFTPLAGTVGLKGSIPGNKGLEIINYYTVAFFDHVLRGGDQEFLLPNMAPFEETLFETRQ